MIRRRLILFLLISFCFSQDVLFTISGNRVEGKFIEVTPKYVLFQRAGIKMPSKVPSESVMKVVLENGDLAYNYEEEVSDEFNTPHGLKIKVAPLTYRAMTRTQLAQYEQQKIYATVNASTMSEEDKSRQFATSFAKVNEINISLLVDSIIQITTSDEQVVTDKQQIKNFVNNCEAKIINEVQDKLVEVRQQAQIKPLKIKATAEQIKQGVPATFDVPITFDNSNFFG